MSGSIVFLPHDCIFPISVPGFEALPMRFLIASEDIAVGPQQRTRLSLYWYMVSGSVDSIHFVVNPTTYAEFPYQSSVFGQSLALTNLHHYETLRIAKGDVIGILFFNNLHTSISYG